MNRRPLRNDYPFEMGAESEIRSPDEVFDELLVLYAQAGRRAALDRLAARWRTRHYAHARRLLGSPDRAADAVQEAWIGIVRGLWRLRDPARFPAWSYAIVTRRCRDLVRREARNMETSLDDTVEPAAGAKPESVDELRRGIGALSGEQRVAVSLFYRDGFTVLEIAEVLQIPVGTVKTRLFHARRTLRRFLLGDES